MKRIMYKTAVLLGNKKGMEMVQVAILVARFYKGFIHAAQTPNS